MIVWNLILVWILMSLFKDTAGTVCSDAVTDGTSVLNMCEGGNAVGDHVVIDTYGSSVYRQDGGSINCSCTATLVGLSDGTTTTVGYEPVLSLYPPSGCRSSITISTQVAAFSAAKPNTYLCRLVYNTFNSVQKNDTITVVWQSGANGSTSGYCLSFRAGPDSSLSTKCNHTFNTTTLSPTSPSTASSPTSPSTTTPTSTTAMTSLMTTTSTTTTTDPTTTITSTIGGGTNGGGAITSSEKPTMSPEATTMADKIKEKNLDTTVIIAIAAGGVVFLIICIVIAVMCSRTKRKSKEHRETETAVDHNVLYEATRAHSPDAATNHVVTPSGDIYAQVERHSKVETTNSKEQSHDQEQEIGHVATPSGDIYAQVEKHWKVETAVSKKRSHEPEQEIEHVTTPGGDMYAQIEKHSKGETTKSTNHSHEPEEEVETVMTPRGDIYSQYGNKSDASVYF
ncbi:endochitinase A-like [Mizuhopecten yessoensis]|uniref:endochitinase A-like n=1 Tax=Mizuhopecten yessoensis TaxID=6573 RepID=UPI000B45D1B5|nr:endochitinase A-like [Mizuhopecten yessoensis]